MKKYDVSIIRKIFVITMFLILCITSNITAAQKNEIVRVGYYDMEGFQSYDESGNLTGYNCYYLNMISSLAGWEYEYVNVADFADGMEKLKNKEIDLLAPAMKTPEREEEFSFSQLSFGTEYSVLITSADNNDYYYEDYKRFDGMKVAVTKDYPMTEYFRVYMAENNFKCELVYCDTDEESHKALAEGRVEAIVSSQMAVKGNEKVLARFSPMPFYYITWKYNTALLSDLNKAMKRLQNTYPGILEELFKTYFPVYDKQYFLREDVEFVEKAGTLRVAYIADRNPVSFTNEDTGELDGISREIFDRIQEISGLQFEYVALPQGSIEYSYLLENKIDLVTGVEFNNANINSKGILLTTPYFAGKKTMVGTKDLQYNADAKYKIAIPTGSQTIKKVLGAEYPNFEIVDYDTIEDCFKAVKNGEADLLLQNQYVVDNWLIRPQYEELKVISVESMNDEICFSTIVGLNGMEGMTQEKSARLIAILDKAISQISEDELEEIVVRQTAENLYEYKFSDFIFKYRYYLAIILPVLMFTIIVAGYIEHIKKKSRNAIMEEEKLLKLQKKRYEMVLENSTDMIYEVSMLGDSCIVSDKIKDKFGWDIPKKVENITIDKMVEIFHINPSDREHFKKYIVKVIVDRESCELVLRIWKEKGEYIWCKLTCFPLIDENQELASIVGKIEDINDAMVEKEILANKSRTDGMTGLLNKQTFAYEAENYLAHNSAINTGIIFLDMDNFKNVNDMLGHLVGDKVIIETGKKLQVIFANVDLVARFGGDEFCVFVKDIPKETLEYKLAWAVEKLRDVYAENGISVAVSASIGAVYCTRENVDYAMMVGMADQILYEVKNEGRNAYKIKEI